MDQMVQIRHLGKYSALEKQFSTVAGLPEQLKKTFIL